MQPRTRGDAVPQPKSALAVVSAVRRVHKRLHYALPPTPRVAQLSNALEVCIVRSDGPDALAASRKAPLTLELILGANDKASGLTVGGRIVDWEAPFWKCYRAAELALWFSGARKADLLTTTNTPFDRSRVSRAHLAFDDKGATLRLATTKADPTGAINAAYALVLADADGDGADGAAALRAYHAACPPRDDVPLGDQPLFAVEGVALSGELFEKIHRAILVNFLGDAASSYSTHSFRSGAATALRAANFTDEQIMRACRWRSMPVMQLYARDTDAARGATTAALRSRDRGGTSTAAAPWAAATSAAARFITSQRALEL
jgi:hypothetical protein